MSPPFTGPDRYPAVLADQATTTATGDDLRHAVYDTGSFGIITHCGQTGATPIRAGAIDCPTCAGAIERVEQR
jgi:hypothetical protein